MVAHRIFVTREIPSSGTELLAGQGYDVIVNYSGQLTENELCSRVAGVSAIVCLLTDTVTAKVIDAAGPALKVISVMAAGYDNVDTARAGECGIRVTNTPGVLTNTVAEHALAMMLALTCRVVEGDRFVREGKFKGWHPLLLLGTDLREKTIGVIGAGHIGQAFTRMVVGGLGMRALYYTHSGPKPDFEEVLRSKCGNEATVQFAGLETLLEESDVVVLFVPLTNHTRHMIGAGQLSKMKSTAFLINMARGPVVDELALVRALGEDRIRGAALDVYENEPEVSPGLIGLPNVVLAPHTGSASKETRSRMSRMAAQNIIDVLEGKTPPLTTSVAAPVQSKVLCFSDGASRGNPGHAGGGVLILSENGNPLAQEKVYFGKTTNNEAEYRALIYALESAQKIAASYVVCTLDSELVVKQLNNEYRVESENLKKFYLKAQELAGSFRKAEFRHAPRTDQYMRKVDRLANEAIDTALKK